MGPPAPEPGFSYNAWPPSVVVPLRPLTDCEKFQLLAAAQREARLRLLADELPAWLDGRRRATALALEEGLTRFLIGLERAVLRHGMRVRP